jgi:hypothetical protein
VFPLSNYQTANPLRDTFIAAFPLKPAEDPSIKGGMAALFRNESGIYYVIDDSLLFAASAGRLREEEWENFRSLQATELSSSEIAASWVTSYLRFLLPEVIQKE